MNELDIAKRIAAGDLESPQMLDNCALFDMRVTGTGVAFRSKMDTYVYRDPEFYLNTNFVERCSGVPVIWEHPDTESGMLDSEEFANRVIGSVMFGYPKDDEVWGIARIYDMKAADAMMAKQLSTSPCVAFAGGEVTQGDNGEPILVENEPVYLDHLAVCEDGVWDKGGDPTGIKLDIAGDSMALDPTAAPVAAAAPSPEERLAKLEAMVQKILGAEQAEASQIQADADPSQLMGDPELGREEIQAVDAAHDLDQNALMSTDMCGSTTAADDDGELTGEQAPFATAADDDGGEKAEDVIAADDDDDDDDDSVKENPMAEKTVAADASADLMREIKRLQAQITEMKSGSSDEDRNALSAAQKRADAVYSAFSDSAPAPMVGENPLAYRRRLLNGMKKHSSDWKDADISKITDAAVLKIAEDRIYADAVAASNSTAVIGKGNLVQRERRSAGGHVITEFSGDPEVTWGPFKHPRAGVSAFNKGV